MAQGQATKEKAVSCKEAISEIAKAFPKSKVGEFIGHFNDVLLFLSACEKVLPSEKAENVAGVTYSVPQE